MPKKLPRKNIISFSGGKDSTALILWATENLDDFDTVWMDTGWEHPWTYDYVDYIDKKLLDGELVRLKSSEYEGFEDLSIQKKRVPSAKARFCTQKLKLEPLIAYFDTLRDDFEIYNYVGIRAEESIKRSEMKKTAFDLDYFGCWIRRPLLDWKAQGVFDMLDKHEVDPNPLYKVGMSRVGCMPCVMNRHSDFRQIMERFPDVIDKVRRLEEKLGRSFFPPNYIPDRYCSQYQEGEVSVTKVINDPLFGARKVTITKKKTSWYPLVDDVVTYLRNNPDQEEIFESEPQSCMSHYAICE